MLQNYIEFSKLPIFFIPTSLNISCLQAFSITIKSSVIPNLWYMKMPFKGYCESVDFTVPLQCQKDIVTNK